MSRVHVAQSLDGLARAAAVRCVIGGVRARAAGGEFVNLTCNSFKLEFEFSEPKLHAACPCTYAPMRRGALLAVCWSRTTLCAGALLVK